MVTLDKHRAASLAPLGVGAAAWLCLVITSCYHSDNENPEAVPLGAPLYIAVSTASAAASGAGAPYVQGSDHPLPNPMGDEMITPAPAPLSSAVATGTG